MTRMGKEISIVRDGMQYKSNLNSHKPNIEECEMQEIWGEFMDEFQEYVEKVLFGGTKLEIALEGFDVCLNITRFLARIGALEAFLDAFGEHVRVDPPWVGGTEAESDERRRE